MFAKMDSIGKAAGLIGFNRPAVNGDVDHGPWNARALVYGCVVYWSEPAMSFPQDIVSCS